MTRFLEGLNIIYIGDNFFSFEAIASELENLGAKIPRPSEKEGTKTTNSVVIFDKSPEAFIDCPDPTIDGLRTQLQNPESRNLLLLHTAYSIEDELIRALEKSGLKHIGSDDETSQQSAAKIVAKIMEASLLEGAALEAAKAYVGNSRSFGRPDRRKG